MSADQPHATSEPLPDVDVIIATHNRPELLRIALDAVLSQTYPGLITCHLVYDRSEPDHGLVHDSRNRVVRVTTNQRTPGLAGARNTGIGGGDAQFVAFCDDDDEWLPTKIEKQIALMTASPALTCVTGIIINYEDRSVPRVPTEEGVGLHALVRNRTMEAHPSTVVVRRSALAEIGLVDEEIPGSYGEDFDWIIRAAETGAIAVVPEALVKVRWGQSLFSTNWQVIIDAIDYGLDKHPAFSEDRRALARLLGRKSFALAALGRRSEALATARICLQTFAGERRAVLAIAVALRLVSADRLMRFAHRRGHGI